MKQQRQKTVLQTIKGMGVITGGVLPFFTMLGIIIFIPFHAHADTLVTPPDTCLPLLLVQVLLLITTITKATIPLTPRVLVR